MRPQPGVEIKDLLVDRLRTLRSILLHPNLAPPGPTELVSSYQNELRLNHYSDSCHTPRWFQLDGSCGRHSPHGKYINEISLASPFVGTYHAVYICSLPRISYHLSLFQIFAARKFCLAYLVYLRSNCFIGILTFFRAGRMALL